MGMKHSGKFDSQSVINHQISLFQAVSILVDIGKTTGCRVISLGRNL